MQNKTRICYDYCVAPNSNIAEIPFKYKEKNMSKPGVKTNATAWQPTTQPASKSSFTARPFPEIDQQQETAGYGEKAAPTASRSGVIANINHSLSTNPIPAVSHVGMGGVQAKLAIGEPGDQYEQEADKVAADVVQKMNNPEAQPMTSPQTGANKSIQRQPVIPILSRMPAPREMQRKNGIQAGNVPQVQADFEGQLNQARGGGSPLDAAFRAKIEPAMGADFSGVRVHTDSQADQMSQAIQAKAFTTGSDVFFRQGAYEPGSRGGQELIAHELTHVVQQQPESKIQRGLVDDFVLGARNLYHNVAEGVGIESHDEAEAAKLQAFIEHGVFGPQALVPPTNIGGFDASFDPQSGVLLIEVRTGVNFQNGLSLDGSNVITANHTDLTQAATDGMNLAPGDRAAFVTDFTWTDEQKQNFISQLQARVESAWSGQYAFSCTRPGWESLMANVAVSIDVHEGAAGGNEHLQTTTYKVPDGGSYNVGAFVQSGNDQDAHNNQLVMSSTHVNPTPIDRSLLRKTVFFDHNSAVLTANAQSTLSAFAADFQDANLDLSNPVTLEGHASSPGSSEYNNKLAQARIDAVRTQLAALGFTGINDRVSTKNMGETDATEAQEWRRVDLIVGSGEGQLVAAHEFGHVFGLADEYSINPGGSINGSGNPVGTIVGHDAMAKAIGASGAVAENNDNIMSLGNMVQPQHYATFGWALAQVSGVNEWQAGSP
jgi:outer membrane protein OmpA-like peptidoglycan-associated protein